MFDGCVDSGERILTPETFGERYAWPRSSSVDRPLKKVEPREYQVATQSMLCSVFYDQSNAEVRLPDTA